MVRLPSLPQIDLVHIKTPRLLARPFVFPSSLNSLPVPSDPTYPYNHLKPSFPVYETPVLEPFDIVDRGFSAPSRQAQLDGASKKENTFLKKAESFKFITPALGAEVRGIDLRNLTEGEKDDL